MEIIFDKDLNYRKPNIQIKESILEEVAKMLVRKYKREKMNEIEEEK